MVASHSTKPQKPHAVLVCFPLQGHVNPSVHLACRLAEKGFTITFINTQSVHRHLTKSNKQDGDDGDIFSGSREQGLDIRYVTIPDGLPVEWDRSVNHDQFMAALLHVYSAHVEEALKGILKSTPPVNCLIADTFFVFPGKLAKKYDLIYISFWTEPALVFTLYYHIHLLKLNGHYGCSDVRKDEIDYVPGVGSIRPKDLMSYIQETDTTTVCHQIIDTAFADARDHADFVLCNTIQELEQHTIGALQEKMKFFAAGPIFPPSFSSNPQVKTSLWLESDCTQWLNSKPHGSVLYVSFGSYAHLSKQEILEIAYGLSLSQENFIWARPDMVSSNDSNLLPRDIIEEVSDRGLIIPWCNQKQVLTNPAVGGFLTHCGWNSTLESIWCEVPLLCFPLLTDQFTNRKLIVDDWKIGMDLCDKKPISKLEIAGKIKQLIGGKSSEELRNAMKKVKKTMEDALSKSGSSRKNLDQFISNVLTTIHIRGGHDSIVYSSES